MVFFNRLLKQPSITSQGIVAISFLANGFAVAVSRYNENNRPRLVFCDFITAPQPEWPSQLEMLVKNHRLDNYACHILLPLEQYRSYTIETPPVNNDEIKQAVRWRVAEMLDYPVEEASVDFFPLPRSNRANTTPLVEAICCNNQLLGSFIQPCKQAGLRIKVIDIQETALRNLATLLPENEQGVAVLHLQPSSGHIIIQKQGTIYLSRKFDLGYNLLFATSVDNEENMLMERNNLALEIQRSFDYVENYFDIPPINSLTVVLMPRGTEEIVNFLMTNQGITTRAMDLSAIVDGDIPLNDGLQNICAPVIGASLRRYVDSRS